MEWACFLQLAAVVLVGTALRKVVALVTIQLEPASFDKILGIIYDLQLKKRIFHGCLVPVQNIAGSWRFNCMRRMTL
jgi:hypothetical protein